MKREFQKAVKQTNMLASSVVTGYITGTLDKFLKKSAVAREVHETEPSYFVTIKVEGANIVDYVAERLSRAQSSLKRFIEAKAFEVRDNLAMLKAQVEEITKELEEKGQKQLAIKLKNLYEKTVSQVETYLDRMEKELYAALAKGELNKVNRIVETYKEKIDTALKALAEQVSAAAKYVKDDLVFAVTSGIAESSRAIEILAQSVADELKKYISQSTDQLITVKITMPDTFVPGVLKKFADEFTKQIDKLIKQIQVDETRIIAFEFVNPLTGEKLVRVYEVEPSILERAVRVIKEGLLKLESWFTQAYTVAKENIQKGLQTLKQNDEVLDEKAVQVLKSIDATDVQRLAYVIAALAAIVGTALAVYIVARAKRVQAEGNYELYLKYNEYINVEAAYLTIKNIDLATMLSLFMEQRGQGRGRVSDKLVVLAVLALLVIVLMPVWVIIFSVVFGLSLGFAVGTILKAADNAVEGVIEAVMAIKEIIIEHKVMVGGFALAIIAALVVGIVIRKLTKQRLKVAQKNQVVTADMLKQARKAGMALTSIV